MEQSDFKMATIYLSNLKSKFMKNWTIRMDETDTKIYKQAKWDGFEVNRHERYTDGSYVVSKSEIPMVFFSGNKLYYPNFAPFTFTITSLCELNMDSKDKSCGVYFSLTKVE